MGSKLAVSRYLSIRALRSLSEIPRSRATSRQVLAKSLMFSRMIETLNPAVLSARMIRPLRSVMTPRGAGSARSLSRLASDILQYFWWSRTCTFQ